MAGMSAYYLSKRREEEEAQRQAMREQVAAKNDALRAKEAQMREQAKIQNYLQGKAMLEAQLASSALSQEAKNAIREYGQAKGMGAGLNLASIVLNPNSTTLNWPAHLRPIESFHQDQNSLPQNVADKECVTTAAVVVRNIMNEYLADISKKPALPDLLLHDYVGQTDRAGPFGLPVRIASYFPDTMSGMMHPRIQMPNALNQFASEFRMHYGCSFTITQTSGNSLDDIVKNLKDGNLVIVHGMREAYPQDGLPYYLGGWPHTMGPVVKVDMDTNTIRILDTLKDEFYEESLQEFHDFWGRPSTFNLYTKPNTMTVLVPDSLCAIPAPAPPTAPSLPDATGTPLHPSSTPNATGTPEPP
jgi:hypothetical protein